MDKPNQLETLEESIFKTLSHQKRRDIIRIIGEKKQATFTEIKSGTQMDDSPSVSYHLNALDGLIIQHEGKYRLTELGQDAYGLICKTASSSESTVMLSSIRKLIPVVIVINAALWATALLLTGQFEGRLGRETIFAFAALWLVSNGILYSLLKRIQKSEGTCLVNVRLRC